MSAPHASLCLALLLSSCGACDEDPFAGEVGGDCESMGGTPCECVDGTASCTDLQGRCNCPGEKPETPEVEIPVDDDNRFVREDLDAFLQEYPDVVRDSDAERMRTCLGDACLEEVPADVGPFDEEGVRYLVPLWLRACLSGSGAGCQAAAQTYNASTVGRDPIYEGMTREELDRKTGQYATRACMLSDSHCRIWASRALRADDSAEADVTRAIGLMNRECQAGGRHACALLGREARAGRHGGAISAARGWYQKACELDGDAPFTGYCDDYGRILYEAGRRSDREEATRILAPICDVSAEAWARECQGDAEAGTQQCPRFEMRFGESCAAYAETVPPAEALPIFSVLCRSLAVGTEENATQNTENCRRALRLARQTDRPAAFVQAILTRACEAIETNCRFENEFDDEICGPVRQRCMENGP